MMPPGMRILTGRQLRRPRRRVVRPVANAHRRDRLEQIRAARALRRARLRVLTQRRHVVEDPEAASVRAGDEVGAQTRAVVLDLESRTEIAGMLKRSDRQWSPSSNDTHTCTSVAAYSSPFFRGSSRIEFAAAPAAMPVLISVHVLPPSCVRQKCGFRSSMRSVFAAAYAVVLVEVPGLDVEDARPRLDRRRRDVRPLRAAVHRHLNHAVVGAGPDRS